MAYQTHIQQVLAYLKQGNKILPATGAVPPISQTPPPAMPFQKPQGVMPTVNPMMVR